MARQQDPRPPSETDQVVNSLLPMTRSIPTNQLYPCYLMAIEMRAPGNTYLISGIELVQAWKELQGKVEMDSLTSTKLLPENAASACVRCWKRRDERGRILESLEIDPASGDITNIPCDHRPLSDEEKRQAEERRTNMLADAQRQARERREQELREKEEAAKPKAHHLFCSQCKRRVSSLAGWQAGEPCDDRLEKESAVCPKCETPAGVFSLGRMTCRECFTSYDFTRCQGVMEAALLKPTLIS